jgi:ABC-type sugar transport system substrate-binding protein
MHRLVLALVLIVALAVLSAAPALAFQCPKLIGQINSAAGNRFDATAYDARVKAAEAQKLHAEGKHPESEKAAKEALDKLGVKM